MLEMMLYSYKKIIFDGNDVYLQDKLYFANTHGNCAACGKVFLYSALTVNAISVFVFFLFFTQMPVIHSFLALPRQVRVSSILNDT